MDWLHLPLFRINSEASQSNKADGKEDLHLAQNYSENERALDRMMLPDAITMTRAVKKLDSDVTQFASTCLRPADLAPCGTSRSSGAALPKMLGKPGATSTPGAIGLPRIKMWVAVVWADIWQDP